MQITDTQIWGALSGAVGLIIGLTKLIWAMVKKDTARLEGIIDFERERSDQRADQQSVVISALQEDVKRMSKGCGFPNCLWKSRE